MKITKKVYVSEGYLTLNEITTKTKGSIPSRFEVAKELFNLGLIENNPEAVNWKKMIKNLSSTEKFKMLSIEMLKNSNYERIEIKNEFSHEAEFIIIDSTEVNEEKAVSAIASFIVGLRQLTPFKKEAIVLDYKIIS